MEIDEKTVFFVGGIILLIYALIYIIYGMMNKICEYTNCILESLVIFVSVIVGIIFICASEEKNEN